MLPLKSLMLSGVALLALATSAVSQSAGGAASGGVSASVSVSGDGVSVSVGVSDGSGTAGGASDDGGSGSAGASGGETGSASGGGSASDNGAGGSAGASNAASSSNSAGENARTAAKASMKSGVISAKGNPVDMAKRSVSSTPNNAPQLRSNQTEVQALIGASVASSSGERVGRIDGFVDINGETMVVIGVGGFFGIGERSILLPATELMMRDQSIAAMGYTSSQLESMRRYQSSHGTSLSGDGIVTLGNS